MAFILILSSNRILLKIKTTLTIAILFQQITLIFFELANLIYDNSYCKISSGFKMSFILKIIHQIVLY